MEVIFSLGNQLKEYLVYLSSIKSANIGKITNDISQYAIQNRSDIMKNASIFIALSYVGVFFGGQTGLALGGIAGGLAAMGLLKLSNGKTISIFKQNRFFFLKILNKSNFYSFFQLKGVELFNKIGSSARRILNKLKLPNFITLTTIGAALSFLCFALGGRVDMAVGGLLLQAISYTTVEFKYGKHFQMKKNAFLIVFLFNSNIK